MILKKIIAVLILFVFLCSSNIYSWNLHYLVMDRTLEHPSMAFTSNKVKVETLDEFLSKEKNSVKAAFDAFYSQMEKKGSRRFKKTTFDVSKPNTAEFLRTARLNPDTKFSLVRRVLPGEKVAGKLVPFKEVSPYLEEKYFLQFESMDGKEMSIRSILYTFLDEPDWKMDHTLWGYEEYGYGKQPYGKPEGISSKAPFHMLFLHENFMVKLASPDLLEGMVLDRVEMFSLLAKTAYDTGHYYWAYRFGAWAIHYLQDICQPYHSNAVPFAGYGYYISFIFSSEKSKIKNDTTQVLSNRHFIYEDFVGYGLEKSYTENIDLYKKLQAYLYAGEAYINDNSINSPGSLLDYASSYSFTHGEALDKSIRVAFGKQKT